MDWKVIRITDDYTNLIKFINGLMIEAIKECLTKI